MSEKNVFEFADGSCSSGDLGIQALSLLQHPLCLRYDFLGNYTSATSWLKAKEPGRVFMEHFYGPVIDVTYLSFYVYIFFLTTDIADKANVFLKYQNPFPLPG